MKRDDPSDRYRLVESLYQQAVDLSPDRRADFLHRRCAGDAALRKEIETLLAHYAEADTGFLDRPLHDLAGAYETDRLPKRIGRYEIIRLVGEGGMGVVFEASQQNPQRSVAIKAIRPGIPSPDSLRRFEHEAAILGRLQHPGIAHVYEAGIADMETSAGAGTRQPFFVMELIRGEPLMDFANTRGLNALQRLDLFTRICDAVEYAHRKGVIHRDLKPANILVTADGVPKILDFGVARVTDSDVQMTTMHTHGAQVVGTLPYMSPEQVGGRTDQVDTRSDVYSLGVILFELLAGRLPYELADKPLAGAARVICDEPPQSLGMVNREYRGDLDTIVAKALEKDPDRRYPSAYELAADVRRYLKREPIAARPASTAYQLRMFGRRNKALVGGIAATFVALVLGVIGTSYGMVEMGRQRDEAALQAGITEAVNEFLTDDLLALADPDKESDRDIPLSVALDRASENVEGRFDDAPLVEASIRKTIGKTYSHLGRLGEAERHLSRALELYVGERGDVDETALLMRMELAALVMDKAEYARAEEAFLELVDIQREVLGPEHEQTMASMHNLATIYVYQNRFAEAEPLLEETLDLRLRVLGEDDTHTATTINNLATVYMYTGQLEEAVEYLNRALEINMRVSGEEHPKTLQVIANLGVIYNELERYEEAEEKLVKALELHRRVLGESHRGTLNVARNLAGVYKHSGKPELREALLRETLEAQRRVLGDEHLDTLVTRSSLARVAFDEGEYAEAETAYADLVRSLAESYPKHMFHGLVRVMQGRCLMELERFEEAEPLLREGHGILVAALGEAHRRVVGVVETIVTFYERWGRPEQADEWRAKLPGDSPADSADAPVETES